MSFALSMRMRSFEILSNVVEADVDVIPVCEDMLTMVSEKETKRRDGRRLLDRASNNLTYQWFWVMSPLSSMPRHEVHSASSSWLGFQMRWPQMTYLRLRESRLFMTHSAISRPDEVGTYLV